MKTTRTSRSSHRVVTGGTAILFAACLAPVALAMSPPGILWERLHFEPEASTLHAIGGNGAGLLVAVGEGGVIRQSSDHGASWSTPPPDIHLDLHGICWDGSRFLVVGGVRFEKGIVLRSTDGSNWLQSCLGSSHLLSSVCSSGSRALAVGDNHSCFHSDDLRSWSGAPLAPNSFGGTLWDGGQFIRVGEGLIDTSPDGVTWTSRYSASYRNQLNAIAWNGSTYVAVGYDWTSGMPMVLRSADSITWSPAVSVDPGIPAFTRLQALTWTGTSFIAAGTGGNILTSPDGGTWYHHQTPVNAGIHGLFWDGSHLLAVGEGGLILRSSLATPVAASDWEIRSPMRRSNSFHAFAQATVGSVDRIVAVGENGTIGYSDDDGTTGGDASSPTSSSLWSVTANGLSSTRKFIAVGDMGTIVKSPDGLAWSLDTSPSTAYLKGVTWARFLDPRTPERAIAVGSDGTILVGEYSLIWRWQLQTTPTSMLLHSVAAGEILTGKPPVSSTLLVAVGEQGTILTSPDGGTWTSRISGTDEHLHRVIPRTHGGFLAVGAHGTVLTSINGVTWSKQSYPNFLLRDVAATGTQYVAVGDAGSVGTSPDGVTWTRRYTPTLNPLWAVLACRSGRLLASAGGGTVLISDPAPDFDDWMASQTPPPGMAGPDDDPNGDGLTNLVSYGFGIPAVATPSPADHARLLRWSPPANSGRVRLRLQPNELTLPDLVYRLESSPSLAAGSWTNLFTYNPGQECGSGLVDLHRNDGGFAEIELRDVIGINAPRFYRIRIEKSP